MHSCEWKGLHYAGPLKVLECVNRFLSTALQCKIMPVIICPGGRLVGGNILYSRKRKNGKVISRCF